MRRVPQAPRWVILLAFGTFLGVPIVEAQDATSKKPLAVEDLYLMESVRSPTLFPKEEKLVYERVWIDPKTKEERHSLWIVDGKRENRKPLEDGEPDGRSPVVSPDGHWIAFLSTRKHAAGAKQVPPAPPYSDAAVDIWLYHVKSGQVKPLGGPDRPWGRVFHDGFYGHVAFSADSAKLVFVADDGAAPRTYEEQENDVEIVRPDQGEGYTGYGPAQLWIAELDEARVLPEAAASKITRLTTDDIWYGDPQWSPDGKSIAVHANKTKDRESVRFSINKNFDLFLIDVASKKQTQLTDNSGPDVSPRFSPGGKQIAYLSGPRKGPHRDVFGLAILTLALGRPKGIDLKNLAPAFPLGKDCWQSEKSLVFSVDIGTTTLNSKVNVVSGEFAFVPNFSTDGQKIQSPASRLG